MVGDKLARDLLSFGKPIIAVGDPFQLPPIGEEGAPFIFRIQIPVGDTLRVAAQFRFNLVNRPPLRREVPHEGLERLTPLALGLPIAQDIIPIPAFPIRLVGRAGSLLRLVVMEEADALLTEIHRQARGNPILRVAEAVREGRSWWREADGKAVCNVDRLSCDEAAEHDVIISGTNRVRRATNRRLRKHLGFSGIPQRDEVVNVSAAYPGSRRSAVARDIC